MHEIPSDRVRLEWVREVARQVENFSGPNRESAEFADQLFDAAAPIVERMTQISPNPRLSRTGGVMVVLRPGEDGFCFARQIGQVDQVNPQALFELDRSKIDKYFVFALMKAYVLAQNQNWQSSRFNYRVHVTERYKIENWEVPAGGIRLPGTRTIIAFSGFQEDDDEAVCLATAINAELLLPSAGVVWSGMIGNQRFRAIAEQLL